MRVTAIVLTVSSALLIGAHFLRSGSYALVAVALAAPFLLMVKASWAVRGVQTLLVLATAEWIYTLVVLAAERRAMGAPWIRMALILGGVAAVTASAAWLLQRPRAND